MTEIWKAIPGFEGKYEVSDFGNVRSLSQRVASANGFRVRRGKLLSQNLINSGYHIAHLYYGEKRTAFLVHRLVVTALAGEIPVGMTVNHKNGIKTDNRLLNLEVVSYTDNHRHAVEMGLNPSAVSVRSRLLTTGETETFPSIAEAAFRVCGDRTKESLIRKCVRGKRKVAFCRTWEVVE